MRIFFFKLFCSVFFIGCVSAFAFAVQREVPENGIWTGVVGESKVVACFYRSTERTDHTQSAYFYSRYAKMIALHPDGHRKNRWIEGDGKKQTGTWDIQVQQDSITGNWSNVAKSKTLPIALERFVALSPNIGSGCDAESSVFSPPVFTTALVPGALKQWDDKEYRLLTGMGTTVSAVELLGQGDTIALLNTLLANQLRVELSAYFACPIREELSLVKKGKAAKPEYEVSILPVFWNERWISFVSRSSGDCGGAYPFSGFTYFTWDLLTGKMINPWQWIKAENKTAPEGLNRLITKRAIKQRLAFNPKEAKEENNCLSVIEENRQYDIRLSKSGFVFTQQFPHVTQACTDDIEVTYSELTPFLNKKGKEFVMGIQKTSLTK